MSAENSLLCLVATILFLGASCSPRYDPPPRPAVISHMDIAQKKTFIDKTRSTLKVFHVAARDLKQRKDSGSRAEMAEQVERFMDQQVVPIIRDFEAGSSLETRIEIAELQLLCAMVYYELGEFWGLRNMLDEMESRYEDQPDVRQAALDVNELGFKSLDEGISRLRAQLYGVGENLPRPHLL